MQVRHNYKLEQVNQKIVFPSHIYKKKLLMFVAQKIKQAARVYNALDFCKKAFYYACFTE